MMRQNYINPDEINHSKEDYEMHSNQKLYVEMLSDMREVNYEDK